MGTTVAKGAELKAPPKGATFYVAGSFKDFRRVRATIDQLTALGYNVTYDWTRTDEFGSDGAPKQDDPHALDKDRLQMYANNDLRGVRDADFFVMLADEELAGAWVEFGAFLAWRVAHLAWRVAHDGLDAPAFVIEPTRWTIFLECEGVHVISHEMFDHLFPKVK